MGEKKEKDIEVEHVFDIDDLVRHKLIGMGMVTEVRGESVVVEFPRGHKLIPKKQLTILLKY